MLAAFAKNSPRADSISAIISQFRPERNQYVRIQVAPYGARETVESEFRLLLQREDGTFEKDIGSPNEGGLLGELYGNGAPDIEQHLLNIKTHVTKIASGEYDTGTVADRRFLLPMSVISHLKLLIALACGFQKIP